LADQDFSGATKPQLIRLIIQIENALVYKKNRVRVLAAITGLPLKSQGELSFYYHSVIIDETKEGAANGIIGRIEDFVTQYPIEQAYRLLPWDAPTHVPVLPETDHQEATV
jgi:hypothetical protein